MSVATSPNSSRVLAMNIHGARRRPPPFRTERAPSQPPPRRSLRSVPFRFAAPRAPIPPSSLADTASAPASAFTGEPAPRGLVPIYHPLRYPSNGHQSKAEITIRVCPVDEVDGGVAGKANRTRERKRKGGADAGTGAGAEWSAGVRPVVIAFELEITFRTAKCRFSPPY